VCAHSCSVLGIQEHSGRQADAACPWCTSVHHVVCLVAAGGHAVLQHQQSCDCKQRLLACVWACTPYGFSSTICVVLRGSCLDYMSLAACNTHSQFSCTVTGANLSRPIGWCAQACWDVSSAVLPQVFTLLPPCNIPTLRTVAWHHLPCRQRQADSS